MMRRALILLLSLAALPACLSSFGALPAGEALQRAQRSPQHNGESFENPMGPAAGFSPMRLGDIGARSWRAKDQTPPGPIPIVRATQPATQARAEGLRFTWIGHATTLIEIDGFRVLTDPIWSDRCSPVSFAGPERHHPTPLPLEALGEIDAVIISHDHYDHLDEATVRALGARGVTFYVPLGVGSHLRAWGITQVVELDWWGQARLQRPDGRQLALSATPARHFSGRGPITRDKTLWASWAILGDTHRVWFGGDTGYFEGFQEIGASFGGFDLTIVPIGAYDRAWPEVHLNPEEAVQTHKDVRGRVMFPIHWGTFNLGLHPWDEPAERLVRAAKEADITLLMPRPGELMTIDATTKTQVSGWWRGLKHKP